MFDRRNLVAFLTSLTVHTVLLLALAQLTQSLAGPSAEMVLETVIAPERTQQEFSRELEVETEVSESLSLVSGGAVAEHAGGSKAPAVEQRRIETSTALREPEIRSNLGDIDLPGLHELGVDLGEREVSGDVGVVADDYGAALSRITAELIRLMHDRRLLVVWLFDESNSMKDDQEEIRNKFHKVYEELGIAQERDEQLRLRDEPLLTAILSFGEKVHTLAKPTAVLREIQQAIDKIPVDQSGKENMCQAILTAISQYRQTAARGDRRLVIVMVSDESGDDDERYLEEALDAAVKANCPIYILGREAVFGYPYARVRWKDPKYGLYHWRPINRGPETPMPEALQWDGLHARWDVFSSGFGPYSQVRLAKETGGIFFILPSDEANLIARGSEYSRKFDFLDMKEYQPLLVSRRDYVEKYRDPFPFRKGLWDVIVRLNPHLDEQLKIREIWYPIGPQRFYEVAPKEFQKAMRAFALTQTALEMLERLKPLRESEPSQRWRANFDLVYAQCFAYRVRLFQFMLVLDNMLYQFPKNYPKPKDPRSNVWNVRRRQEMIEPTEDQIKRTRVDYELLKEQEKQARELFQFVIDQHPRTPWAQRASYELRLGLGMYLQEDYRDPNYDRVGKDIKVPNF